MKYINDTDYNYIMNKYHDPKTHDNTRISRFMRHDVIFDEKSGMFGDDIMEGIKNQDEKIKNLPHSVRKAKAFEFVLKNTRISCDKRDIFPAMNMINRPMNKILVDTWKREALYNKIPDVEKRRAELENNGIVTIWLDYDHSVPIWDRIFSLGFSGILAESEEARAKFENITDEQNAFFEGIKITYSAIIALIGRLENQAKADGNLYMEEALKNIKNNPPKTFYEALLVDYLYFMICEHIEGLQVRSLGNFDRLLYKFYKSDSENGVSENQIRKDLAYFFLQFTSINNYWNQPVYLGGCNEDESTVINELSYLFLDVYDTMGIFNPKVQIKVAESTPKDFLLKALDMIRHGNNSIAFVSDALIRKALENAGATKEQARLCDIRGCYEYSIRGAYATATMNYLNLLKPLEYALHEGCDGVNGVFAGKISPKIEEYVTFDDFYNEYKAQLAYLIEQVVDVSNSLEVYLSEINPLSMLSATIPSCLEKGLDALGGGAEKNGDVLQFGYIADLADSLTNIKKYVYDNKMITLSELKTMLDNDFEGNEIFCKQLLADTDKYGNNKDLPDSFAKDIVEFLCSKICGKPTSLKRGGKWTAGFHVARMSYWQAPYTASSPNGRLKGQELSKNLSASIGMNREGATAAIMSTTKIDATKFIGDACLDLGLLPSAVKGEDGLQAMYGLLMTFIKRGGHALNINVFNADILRDAQKHPENYEDLQIRVAGWNVLFNNINKEEQDGFIRQAEGLI